MNTILIIGAGKFGTHLAIDLCEMGNEVMLVDKSERKIDEIAHKVTTSEIGDYTVKSNLASLGVEDYDFVFVCVGDFKDSLVIVDYLKELGAKFIIAKASSEIHEKFLLKNGADRVVYPERDVAYNQAVEFSNNHVYDFIKLDDDTGIYEIEVPDKWCGKSLETLNVRRIHNVSVLAKKVGNSVTAIQSPDYVFNKTEHIIVMGTVENVRKLTK